MKQFFKFTLASMLGFLLAAFVGIFLLAGAIGALALGGSEESEIAQVPENSILNLKINYTIPERENKGNIDLSLFGMPGFGKEMGVQEIIKKINDAGFDEHIKGIYLTLDLSSQSFANIEEIRKALLAFKKHNKFIVAYAEMMDENGYYLASTANKIYLNPNGTLILNGLASEVVYLKDALDKLGLEPQLIRHGKFKSAGEPFIANRMSKENRAQIESYLGSLYYHFVEQIAIDRKKDKDAVHAIINELKIQQTSQAKALGMIDDVLYEDQVKAELKKLSANNSDKEAHFVSANSYKNPSVKPSTSDNKIAVLYCNGEIVSGKSSDGNMGSVTICEQLQKIRKDDKFKALVLRINSPGGSALASDVMWREIELIKKEKPVIVSMGSVAASGGYYLAAPANWIIAQPNTITGSIGVFGMLLNAQNLLENKLGIHVETVKFGEFADLGMPNRALNASERQIVQNGVDLIYNDFVEKVAKGRKLKPAQVDSIAQGRVWSGKDALKIGLVDELGGLDRAIAVAAEKAKLTEYRTVQLPTLKEPIEQLFESLSSETEAYFLKQKLGPQYEWFKAIENQCKHQGIQARMDYTLSIH
jgi:protease-4